MLEYNATWTRLKTENVWGLRITVTVKPGDIVLVYRDSTKSVSRETVGEIVWTGPGVTLAKVGPKPARLSKKKARKAVPEAVQVPGFDNMACHLEDEAADAQEVELERAAENAGYRKADNYKGFSDDDLPY